MVNLIAPFPLGQNCPRQWAMAMSTSMSMSMNGGFQRKVTDQTRAMMVEVLEVLEVTCVYR